MHGIHANDARLHFRLDPKHIGMLSGVRATAAVAGMTRLRAIRGGAEEQRQRLRGKGAAFTARRPDQQIGVGQASALEAGAEPVEDRLKFSR